MLRFLEIKTFIRACKGLEFTSSIDGNVLDFQDNIQKFSAATIIC